VRHQKAGYKLNRNTAHRLALYRNLTRALFEHDRIITTEAKAKAVRPFVEKLITLAKRGLAADDPAKALHARRLAIARLHDKAAVAKLFSDIAPRYTERPGGYTRVIKRHERRLGDGGKTAFLELLKAGEAKVRTRPAEAPAPAPEPKPEG
jgi:large subunit ribosomal protein L17